MKKLLMLILTMGCNRSDFKHLEKKIEDDQVASLKNISAQVLVNNIFVKDKEGNYLKDDKEEKIVDFCKLKSLLELMKTNENNSMVKDNLLRTLYATKNDILELLIRKGNMDLIKLFTEVDKKIDFDTIEKRKSEILDLIDGKLNYIETFMEQNRDIKFWNAFLATNTNRELIIFEQKIRVIIILSIDHFSDEQVAKWIEFLDFRGCQNINFEIKISVTDTMVLNEILAMGNKIKSLQALINCGYDFDINYSDRMIINNSYGIIMTYSFIKSISNSITKDHKSNNIMHRNVKDRDGIEIIRGEIHDNREEVIKLCKERNEKGLTPVDYAIALGKSDILKLMFEKEIIEIDQQNCLSITPLMFATIMNQVECMKICLLNGANIREVASNENTSNLIKDQSLPFLAVTFDAKDSMMFALEQMDVDINTVSEGGRVSGMTLLTLSCMFESVDCFNKLIEMGADVNHDSNPLYYAFTNNFVSGIKILIEKGANVNYVIQGPFESPIIIVIKRLNKEIFDLIIDKVDNVNENSEGHTPLIEAILIDVEYFINKLIEKGADVNTKVLIRNDKIQGMTPLMIAIMNKNIAAIKLLLKQDNIDLNIKLSDREEESLIEINKKYNLISGQTALDIAKANGYAEAVDLIEAKMIELAS